MTRETYDKITTIIAYIALPITYPMYMWETRNWKTKSESDGTIK